jgi:hypothetical protein
MLLDRKIPIAGRIDEHLFSVIAQREGIDVVVYPERLFAQTTETDSASLRELMHNIAFEMKFKKAEMSDTEINDVCAINGYTTWGSMKKANAILLPDEIEGRYIFDYYYERK